MWRGREKGRLLCEEASLRSVYNTFYALFLIDEQGGIRVHAECGMAFVFDVNNVLDGNVLLSHELVDLRIERLVEVVRARILEMLGHDSCHIPKFLSQFL